MKTNEELEKNIDRIIDVAHKIKLKELTILVGPNGSGKSLIRKLLWSHVNKLLGIDEKKSMVADISMERRTGVHSNLGGMGLFLRDQGTNPTSLETYNFLKGLLKQTSRYLVIDEPEIGMSEEAQLGISKYIMDNKDSALENNYGILVITHSRIILENLREDNFLDLGCDRTKEEYLGREIIPLDFEELQENSEQLYIKINERKNEKSN